MEKVFLELRGSLVAEWNQRGSMPTQVAHHYLVRALRMVFAFLARNECTLDGGWNRIANALACRVDSPT